MKKFNKFLASFLILCNFSATSIPIFADKFDAPFENEKTSETVLKYFLGSKAQFSDYWTNTIRNAFIDYCG